MATGLFAGLGKARTTPPAEIGNALGRAGGAGRGSEGRELPWNWNVKDERSERA